MIKVIFIILISVITVWSNKKFCNSDTFQNIQTKSILEMSDGEYRIFVYFFPIRHLNILCSGRSFQNHPA
jgi:hypothetical protein